MEKHVKINVSAGAVLLLSALYFVLDWDGLLALLLAAAAHECGHLAALRVCGGRVRALRLDVCGAVIDRRGLSGRWQEALCAAAGPAAGAVWALIASRLGAAMAWPVLVSSSGLSLVLSLFNLLPAPPLDGGRIAEALLGRRACSLLGLITASLTLSAGLYAVARGYGAALFCAGAYLCLEQGRERP